MATSDELYQKGTEVLGRFRSGGGTGGIKGSPSYDAMPGLQRLVTEWAFGGTWSRPVLDIKYRCMATISALTVLGREQQLKNHVRNALGAGLTKEQIAEVMLHVMPHGGAPATLNGLRIAMEVFQERPDLPYNPEPIVPAQTEKERYDKAAEVRQKVYGKDGIRPVIRHGEVYDMDFAKQTIGYIFGVIWSRKTLDLQSRIVCTLSALTAMRLEPQIPNHVRAALNLGLTQDQIMELFSHLMLYGGWDASINAMARANDAFHGRA